MNTELKKKDKKSLIYLEKVFSVIKNQLILLNQTTTLEIFSRTLLKINSNFIRYLSAISDKQQQQQRLKYSNFLINFKSQTFIIKIKSQKKKREILF